MLLVYKMMFPPTTALIDRAATLNADLSKFDTLTRGGFRKEVCKRRVALQKSQKACEAGWIEWLKTEAKERAVASGDKDWEKRLDDMVQVVESRAINRKLGTITKEWYSQALDWIEVSTHDWFHSKKNNEIYHYNNGILKLIL